MGRRRRAITGIAAAVALSAADRVPYTVSAYARRPKSKQ